MCVAPKSNNNKLSIKPSASGRLCAFSCLQFWMVYQNVSHVNASLGLGKAFSRYLEHSFVSARHHTPQQRFRAARVEITPSRPCPCTCACTQTRIDTAVNDVDVAFSFNVQTNRPYLYQVPPVATQKEKLTHTDRFSFIAGEYGRC